ncbi:MAG TPA: protein kinase, partial [Gemmataceae bacterium]|nr:protein kinase [Gemmataceae bacterium]
MSERVRDESEREQKLNEVLLAYVEEAEAGRPPDRQRLLDAHPDFRAELEEFFASYGQVDRLAAPVRRASRDAGLVRASSGVGKGRDNQPPPDIGELGDFRLLREVGRGGMGVVYEAEQISLRRRVALKVLPFAAAIDPRQLQRFKNEAMAAAHLRHESIVPVYAVGQERGVHYYAMQFIEGQSLASLIAGLRRLSGEPSTPGTPESTGPYLGSGASETQLTEADVLATESFSRERSSHS